MKQFFITSFLLLCLTLFVMEKVSASTSETIDNGTNVVDSLSDICEGDVCAEFDYNSDGDRVRMKVTKDGSRHFTRYYLGGRYESELSGIFLYERLYLGGDKYSAPAVIERTSFALAADTVKPGPIGPLEPWQPSDADIADSSSVSPSGQEMASVVGTRVYYLLRDCLGSALRTGLVHAGMDAAFGAVTGGVSGGVRAHKKGLNLIDGSEKKIYTGYYGSDDEKVVRYVGITGRDPQIRYNEHLNSDTARAFLSYHDQEYFKTRLEARIWEQIQINKFGMQKFGGQLLNKRNEIARKFWHEHGIIP